MGYLGKLKNLHTGELVSHAYSDVSRGNNTLDDDAEFAWQKENSDITGYKVHVDNYTGKTGANTVEATIEPGRYVTFYWSQSNLGSSCSIKDFLLVSAGVEYSLKQAVENGIIQPLVLINSYANLTRYLLNNPFLVYDNSGTASGNYAKIKISFITASTISAVKYTSTGANGYDSRKIWSMNADYALEVV